MNTIATQSITFFKTQAAAEKMVEGFIADGADAAEYAVIEAKGRPGFFIIQVLDAEDGFVLGTI